MEVNQGQHRAWNLSISNYRETEFHHLSKEDLLDIIQEEWCKDFNALFVGRDIDCVGRLLVFFLHSRAYVGYEDFVTNRWWSSYDFEAYKNSNWNEMVPLTPDDAQDYSFQRCSLISKEQAWRILNEYITVAKVTGLFLEDSDGRPVVPRK